MRTPSDPLAPPPAAPGARFDARLDTLQAAVEALGARIAGLEAALARLAPAGPAAAAAAAGAPAQPGAAAAPAPPHEVPVSEETLAVIAATIAAYFGKRPRIRQVTLVSSPAWTHQGRVGVQSSHTMSPRG